MLLRKIRAVGILIFSTLVMLCCSKRYDPSFFKGEWLSDSLVTKENDHWREFLYFDNGRAVRTTAWGRQYLLNKNLSVKGLQLYDHDKALFRIKVVDSNKIIVEGKNYYGSFVRNDHPLDDMKTALAINEETEKQRKKLFGKWKAANFKIVSLHPEDTIIALLPDQRKMADVPTSEITALNFEYHEFSLHCGKRVIPFEYSAEPDKIKFISGDVLFSFKYYFRNEKLVLEYRAFRNVLNSITFEKVR
ncbi:hypothetical protein JET18_02765 [Chryseobacterium sp. L7]|uniref:Lipoprotein n=1 Tax=Chryseobacterium endalhagicum TaxID=2797638 RepID=A0ABS1QAW5_9FLAO|nr:hypothetical protein [Chryseobacterium endalhagicum]MBL1219740.1 hypothetical protein [Chryseobacterium endalhagicum]